MSYTKALDTLKTRFIEKQDTTNQTHKAMLMALNDIAEAALAVETIRYQGRDERETMRAAARLAEMAVKARSAVDTKTAEASASFDKVLREHSGLVNGPYAQEIRQRLHGMALGEKVKVVQSLIESRDGASLAAIFDSPPVLTGLAPEDITKYREQYFQVAAPDIVKSRDIFKDLAEHTTAAILTAQKVAAEYSDPLKLRALELADAEALKARSALGGE